VKIFITTTLILFGIVIPPVADAQFIWNMSHSDFDGRYDYCFDAISCSGNIYTVAGRYADELKERIYQVFWRSIDAGLSWAVQDPGLPADSNFNQTRYFTALQQIDPMNSVALRNSPSDDSTFILRTFDGGRTWVRQYLDISPISGALRDVHFFDSLSGIALAQKNEKFGTAIFYGGGDMKIFTTSNGGRNWDSAKFSLANTSYNYNCYSYGRNSFKIFQSPHGPIYSTKDNWQTVDTTALLMDSTNDPDNLYEFNACNFTGGDTIVAFGRYHGDISSFFPDSYRALLMRSTDGGKSWGSPLDFTDSLWQITSMSSLRQDTVLASGLGINKYLISTDKGVNWKQDSLIISDTAYPAVYSKGIAYTKGNSPLMIFSYLQTDNSIPTIILRGSIQQVKVDATHTLDYFNRIFPNPATTKLNIASVEAPKPFWIIDMLGRTVISGTTLDHQTLAIDISTLRSGVYDVISMGLGGKIIIGKLEVAGK